MHNYIYSNGNLYNTNELKHWKYKNKKKVNGKWRYDYKDSGISVLGIAAKQTRDEKRYKTRDSMLRNKQYLLKQSEKIVGTNRELRKKAFKNRLKIGHNAVMRFLNRIGKGTIDDWLRKKFKK